MKKLIVLLCVVAMLLALAACDKNPSQGTTATPQTTQSGDPQPSQSIGTQPDASQEASQEPSVEATTAPEQTQEGQTAAPEQTQEGQTAAPEQSTQVTTAPTQETQVTPQPTQAAGVMGEALYCDNSKIHFTFVDAGHGKGTITLSVVMTFPEDMLTSMQLNPPFEMIKYQVFDVTVTNDNGNYVASGDIVEVGMKLQGDPTTVARIKEILLNNEDGESELSRLTIRAINGEAITGDDIENYTWAYDQKLEMSFSIDGNKLVFNSFAMSYTEWGTMDELDFTISVQDGVVRKEITMTGGELTNIKYYREDGTREKEEFYYEGTVSSTYYYDENGDLIEDI